MPTYNRMKAESRRQEIADLKAELAAIDNGTWPRDLNDDFRWGSQWYFYDLPEKAAYVKGIITNEVAYLENIPARIVSGELTDGWEL